MNIRNNRDGFTFIELLFVIIIMGIVGGIALEAIRQYYNNIFRTQEITKRVAEADHILEQLSKYFETAISSSIVNFDKNGVATGCEGPPIAGDLNDYTVAFVAADMDSFYGLNGRPGWSEEVRLLTNNDINASDANFTAADAIINALGGSTLRNSAIYDADSVDVAACTRFNWNGLGTAGYHMMSTAANPTSDTIVRLNNDNNATDGRRKYLIRTGYAFKVSTDGNFTMYSNFYPWQGGRYDTALNRKQNLLAQNVAHFYADYNASDYQNDPSLNDRGMVWRLKVCMRGLDANLSNSDAPGQDICRERRVHVRY